MCIHESRTNVHKWRYPFLGAGFWGRRRRRRIHENMYMSHELIWSRTHVYDLTVYESRANVDTWRCTYIKLQGMQTFTWVTNYKSRTHVYDLTVYESRDNVHTWSCTYMKLQGMQTFIWVTNRRIYMSHKQMYTHKSRTNIYTNEDTLFLVPGSGGGGGGFISSFSSFRRALHKAPGFKGV